MTQCIVGFEAHSSVNTTDTTFLGKILRSLYSAYISTVASKYSAVFRKWMVWDWASFSSSMVPGVRTKINLASGWRIMFLFNFFPIRFCATYLYRNYGLSESVVGLFVFFFISSNCSYILCYATFISGNVSKHSNHSLNTNSVVYKYILPIYHSWSQTG